MKRPTFQHIAVAGALCLGLAASAASAQDRPPGPGGAQAQAGPRGPAARGPRDGDRQQRFADRSRQREQRLHDLLQIRPEQDGAFRTFMTALDQAPRRGPRTEDHRPDGQRGPGAAPQAHMTAPERLDREAQRMAERTAQRQQRLQKTTAAVKAFYAVLSPDQRKAFDELPLMRIGDRHEGRRGGHGGGFRGRPSAG